MQKRERIIKKLSEEQQTDGSFGRFHTRDTKLKQRIPTTEAAVWMMFENGITRETEVCNKTCLYMENLIDDLSQWPDAWEKNKYFEAGVPLFIASKLAICNSNNKRYKEICNIWLSLLIEAFKDNEYSADAVNKKSKELVGVEIDGSCIGLSGLNNIALFAFNVDKIPTKIQKLYIKWLRNYDGKISYTNIKPKEIVRNSKSARVISLLSRFSGFNNEFPDLVEE